MVELASMHDEETEKSTREVLNGSNFSEDEAVDFDRYAENLT